MSTIPSQIIIVNDSRCGDSAAFRTMDEFRQAMLDCGWTDDEFQTVIDDETSEIHDAELVQELQNGGLYVYEEAHNMGHGRYETRYTYHLVLGDGSLRYADTLDHPADAEELAEMCQA